jgi:hypothetical protein
MDWIRRHRPSPGTALGFAALVVALGGVAFAAIPDSSGTIHACYQKNGGNLRVIESSQSCRNSEQALSWRQGAGGLAGSVSAAVGSTSDVAARYGTPPADPDPNPSGNAQITLDRPGRILISSDLGGAVDQCGAAQCRFELGLYLDGQPIPETGSSETVAPSPGGTTSTGLSIPTYVLTDPVPAGTHTISALTKSDGNATVRIGGQIAALGPVD